MGRPTSHRVIPERFLRQIWKNQNFRTSSLVTEDGKPVEILSAGRPNPDGGPDFLNARIRIGGVSCSGDVELHQTGEEWARHAHDRDDKYNRVILHVVLRATTGAAISLTKSRRTVPVLILEPYLHTPFHSLWHSMILDERAERLSTIRCFASNSSVQSEIVAAWLRKLAVERFELKVRRFEERLKELADEHRISVQEPQPGYEDIPFGLNPDDLPAPVRQYAQWDFAKRWMWEQLLYEGMMEALGYSKNREPFLRLAQNARILSLSRLVASRHDPHDISVLEGILFGIAGLLPEIKDIKDEEEAQKVEELRGAWDRWRKDYRHEILNKADWQFFRLRPENFPTVRLAGAARLAARVSTDPYFRSIVQLVKARDQQPREKIRSLQAMFIVHADRFWSAHYRFGERSRQRINVLVGKSRANDIILNVVVPIGLLYARIFKDRDVREGVLRLVDDFHTSSTDTITRLMESQLLRGKLSADSAMVQQGLLQLYKFYCMEQRCAECAVGKAVL